AEGAAEGTSGDSPADPSLLETALIDASAAEAGTGSAAHPDFDATVVHTPLPTAPPVPPVPPRPDREPAYGYPQEPVPGPAPYHVIPRSSEPIPAELHLISAELARRDR
ncbi:hypothetical protein ACWGOP_37425, partial [Streptomyces nigrescens]